MKIMMLGNSDMSIYNYRKELIERLLKDNEVVVVTPDGRDVQKMIDMGCKHISVEVDRHGKNPFKELGLLKAYKKILKIEKPDVVLTYTIKPNIYGSMASKRLKIPCIINVTGLGTAVESKGLMQKITTLLYKIS